MQRPSLTDATQNLPADAIPLGVFLDLEERRADGVLRVEAGGRSGWVALRDGQVVGAGAEAEQRRFGRRLSAAGLISPLQLEEALDDQVARPGLAIGRILVEHSSLEPSRLLHAVRAHVLALSRDLAACPRWEHAAFQEGASPPCEPVHLGVSTADLVLTALRGLPDRQLDELAARLAATRPILDVNALGTRFTLRDSEQVAVLALSSDTAQLVRAAWSSEIRDVELMRIVALALLLTPEGEPDDRRVAAEHLAAVSTNA